MAARSDTDESTVLISREFAAPRALVFEAWTRPEHLEKWFGPDGFATTCAMDFRPGGTLRITLTGHGMEHTVSGVYRAIVAPERIELSLRFEDVPEHEMLQIVTFAEHAGKTTISVRQVFPSWDQVSPAHQELLRPRARGSREGWTQTLQHLAEFLAAR